jgi:hypothetical protein
LSGNSRQLKYQEQQNGRTRSGTLASYKRKAARQRIAKKTMKGFPVAKKILKDWVNSFNKPF